MTNNPNMESFSGMQLPFFCWSTSPSKHQSTVCVGRASSHPSKPPAHISPAPNKSRRWSPKSAFPSLYVISKIPMPQLTDWQTVCQCWWNNCPSFHQLWNDLHQWARLQSYFCCTAAETRLRNHSIWEHKNAAFVKSSSIKCTLW